MPAPNDFFEHNTSQQIRIIGIPYDMNSSFMKGSAEAPALIRKALFSSASNLWTEKGIDLGAEGVVFDLGDLAFNATEDPMTIISCFPSHWAAITPLPIPSSEHSGTNTTN